VLHGDLGELVNEGLRRVLSHARQTWFGPISLIGTTETSGRV
jgi:hypothetical protein